MASTPRRITESYTSQSPLRVDREAGVIHGVRILGPVSKNTYGLKDVDATEYAKTAHDDVRRLYEGKACNLNHVRDKKTNHVVEDAFGKFGNVSTLVESDGPVTRGDLHYLKSHEMANRVVEDVERGLGVYGLSHDAFAGREHVDRKRRRLVIESITSVNSIDLVLGAATNRNLWESQEQPTMKTLKAWLDSLADLPPGKAKWSRNLCESAELRNALESDGATVGEAFDAAVTTVLSDPALPASEKAVRVARLLETRERLDATADSEPTVAKPADDTAPELARVLAENAELKTQIAVRQLCESEGFAPKPHQLKSIQLLSTEVERKALIADLKVGVKPVETPRSGFRRTVESTNTTPAGDAKTFAARIKG